MKRVCDPGKGESTAKPGDLGSERGLDQCFKGPDSLLF